MLKGPAICGECTSFSPDPQPMNPNAGVCHYWRALAQRGFVNCQTRPNRGSTACTHGFLAPTNRRHYPRKKIVVRKQKRVTIPQLTREEKIALIEMLQKELSV